LQWASAVALAPAAWFPSVGHTADPVHDLLLIHGRDQQGKQPDLLKAAWMNALTHGAQQAGKKLPMPITVEFPYYGDKLDEFARAYDIPLSSEAQSRGAPVDDEFQAFQYEFAEDIRQRAGVTDNQVEAEYGNEPQERGPLNWKWVQAVLRAIDKHGGGMNQKTLEVFTRDVFLYTMRPGVRDEIDRIVAAKLTERPTVIVAHSLGTIVAYSVLITDQRKLQVPLLVTVGSPLGVRAVRNQFKPLRSPDPVKAWYNAFDKRDVVALYPLDAANFPIRPAIDNNGGVNNFTSNRHGIEGYLNNGPVAGKICSGLAG
jgi:hypothetical protein